MKRYCLATQVISALGVETYTTAGEHLRSLGLEPVGTFLKCECWDTKEVERALGVKVKHSLTSSQAVRVVEYQTGYFR